MYPGSHRPSVTDHPGTLQLTEEEKAEPIDRTLKAQNPNVNSILVNFSWRKDERGYRFAPTMDHTVSHLVVEGNLIRKDSEDHRRQVEDKERRAKELALAEEAERNPQLAAEGVSTKILKNTFNYSDRASQTANAPYKDASIQTEPSPIIAFATSASQHEIYDAYIEDMRQQQHQQQGRSRAQPGSRAPLSGSGAREQRAGAVDEDDANNAAAEGLTKSASLERALKITERMAAQNVYADVADDAAFWEDPGDAYREDSGTLLPLWKLSPPSNSPAKRRHVTAVAWHPKHRDLFAVGYGSYDFSRQGSGAVLCFSLKNPTFPEVTLATSSGVMCLDWHPVYTSLIAIGKHDGSVAVYDVRGRTPHTTEDGLRPSTSRSPLAPVYESDVSNGQHHDPVWQVRWARNDKYGQEHMSFLTASTDGRVSRWSLAKSELQCQDVVVITNNTTATAGEDGDAVLAHLNGPTCLALSESSPDEFVIGLEDGSIRRCSTTLNSQSLQTYTSHFLNVYTVAWSPFHSDVFLSASADWTVRLWEQHSSKPLMTFDVGAAVGDVAWSPHSASVFAAATADGKVHVYDLFDNKHEAICEQPVVHKAHLTRLAFNQFDPILLVGDDHGNVLSLKLSPNLRRIPVVPSGSGSSLSQAQRARLAAIVVATSRDRELVESADRMENSTANAVAIPASSPGAGN